MEEINQIQQGGSKKGLYIIIAIVVILGIWYFMGRSTSNNVENALEGAVGGSTTFSNEEGIVNIGGNKLPDNWPSDAPVYKNTTIQYSGSSNPQTGEKGSMVVFMTKDKAENVVDFYKTELIKNGWTVEQTATIGAMTVLGAKKDTRSLGAQISDAGDGQVSVSIGISIPETQE